MPARQGKEQPTTTSRKAVASERLLYAISYVTGIQPDVIGVTDSKDDSTDGLSRILAGHREGVGGYSVPDGIGAHTVDKNQSQSAVCERAGIVESEHWFPLKRFELWAWVRFQFA